MKDSEVYTESYSMPFVVAQNLIYLLLFGIGTAILWRLPPLLAIVYAVFMAAMLLVVLRKHLCTHCYYYGKRCGAGWGLLAARLFRQGTGNYALGVRLAGVTWGIGILAPIIGGIAVLAIRYSRTDLSLLVQFVLLAPLSMLMHRETCSTCKMRSSCPASMVKKKQ